jgi:sulfatase maturation enzyme AslB (radical SAM superfamily)
VESLLDDYAKFRKTTMSSIIDSMSADPDRLSLMYDWDVDIFVDIIEMQNVDKFPWFDLHWKMMKSEVILLTKEWNDDLHRYCDYKNLTGKERDKIVQIYTASLLARCANPTCKEVEFHVKSFGKCTRCNSVAYCSRGCQKEHWRVSHKKNCGL